MKRIFFVLQIIILNILQISHLNSLALTSSISHAFTENRELNEDPPSYCGSESHIYQNIEEITAQPPYLPTDYLPNLPTNPSDEIYLKPRMFGSFKDPEDQNPETGNLRNQQPHYAEVQKIRLPIKSSPVVKKKQNFLQVHAVPVIWISSVTAAVIFLGFGLKLALLPTFFNHLVTYVSPYSVLAISACLFLFSLLIGQILHQNVKDKENTGFQRVKRLLPLIIVGVLLFLSIGAIIVSVFFEGHILISTATYVFCGVAACFSVLLEILFARIESKDKVDKKVRFIHSKLTHFANFKVSLFVIIPTLLILFSLWGYFSIFADLPNQDLVKIIFILSSVGLFLSFFVFENCYFVYYKNKKFFGKKDFHKTVLYFILSIFFTCAALASAFVFIFLHENIYLEVCAPISLGVSLALVVFIQKLFWGHVFKREKAVILKTTQIKDLRSSSTKNLNIYHPGTIGNNYHDSLNTFESDDRSDTTYAQISFDSKESLTKTDA
ncbi:hypothetical protein AB834_04870 [PVC group bacterium (ex Bugula neritina AB1)]|nr:hypothetical protein AB834_04870 [PVC group bacterium (ex Bugula neritina AB1)]